MTDLGDCQAMCAHEARYAPFTVPRQEALGDIISYFGRIA
jgi:hypothetical protein